MIINGELPLHQNVCVSAVNCHYYSSPLFFKSGNVFAKGPSIKREKSPSPSIATEDVVADYPRKTVSGKHAWLQHVRSNQVHACLFVMCVCVSALKLLCVFSMVDCGLLPVEIVCVLSAKKTTNGERRCNSSA